MVKETARQEFLLTTSTIIRAKRVSNCYIQEKKNVRLCRCSTNLGFSVRSANRIRPKHGIPRSEFLIDTSQKKNLCVCVDVRLILVLVLGRQTVYGQNTVYLCLSKYIPVVFENTHTHIATAASETEGVAAVSWIES